MRDIKVKVHPSKSNLKKYVFEIIFPFYLVIAVKFMRFLPIKIYSYIWNKLGNF